MLRGKNFKVSFLFDTVTRLRTHTRSINATNKLRALRDGTNMM